MKFKGNKKEKTLRLNFAKLVGATTVFPVNFSQIK